MGPTKTLQMVYSILENHLIKCFIIQNFNAQERELPDMREDNTANTAIEETNNCGTMQARKSKSVEAEEYFEKKKISKSILEKPKIVLLEDNIHMENRDIQDKLNSEIDLKDSVDEKNECNYQA